MPAAPVDVLIRGAGPVGCALALALRASGLRVAITDAEGAPHAVEGKRYAQDAIVGILHAEPAAAVTAFERFTPEGPLALLPHAGRYALIWSLRPERAQRLVAASEADFLAELNAVAGAIGHGTRVEQRAVQPLTLKVRAARVTGNEVYIGNAAQTLHPVAGQGLNLGLRDAWELARFLGGAVDPGSAPTLARFAAQRRLDAGATIRITDFLAGGFAGDNPLLRPA